MALHTRLENSADDEELVVAEQLRGIALLRLEGLVAMNVSRSRPTSSTPTREYPQWA